MILFDFDSEDLSMYANMWRRVGDLADRSCPRLNEKRSIQFLFIAG
jgi:hypothetical protein